MERIEIITLKPDQWEHYRDLRLQSRMEDPHAFGSSYEDNVNRPKEAWINRLKRALNQNEWWYSFAKSGDELIGMIGAYIKDDIQDAAHINDMYVAKKYREKGISKLLINDVISKISKNKSIKRLELEVNPDQTAAIQLYKNLGFTIVGTKKITFGDGKERDSLRMEKVL